MIQRIKNFILRWKYPFLTPRNVWTGKKVDLFYSYTLLDQIPTGWRIVFGLQLCKDLKHAWLKLPRKVRKEFMITQIKEKYGELRIYTYFSNEEIERIINKYMFLSHKYCIICGKPAKWESKGYIMPFCDFCKKSFEKHYSFIQKT